MPQLEAVERGLTPTLCSVCGGSQCTLEGVKDAIPLVTCNECGTLRVASIDPQDYIAKYMTGWYQTEHIDTSVQKANAQRYSHDKEIGLRRLFEISKYKTSGMLLDLGCSNGGFVDAALASGFDAYGIDLCDDAFDGSQANAENRLQIAELGDCGFQRRQLDVITMLDVLEHLLDPQLALRQANGLLKRDGLLVIDMPDFGGPLALEGLEYRHVKPIEHVWYPSQSRLEQVLHLCDFEVLEITRPVKNKIVVYARPNPKTVMDVRVWGPTGLGDMHWVLLKLGALKESESPCTLRLTIPGFGDPKMIFRAAGFLKLLPMLDSYDTEVTDAVQVDEGAKDVTKPHYRLIANGHIERGHRIDNWYPHLKADYHYQVDIPERDMLHAQRQREHTGRKLILLYASNEQWNYNITGNKAWTSKDWVALIATLNELDIYPVLIGKAWDRDFANRISAGTFVDLIGKTSEGQLLALFKISDAVVGLCSGATILSVHIGAKSLVFWPERGKIGANMEFHKDFQTDWADPRALESKQYIPLSLGTFDVDDVIGYLADWGAL